MMNCFVSYTSASSMGEHGKPPLNSWVFVYHSFVGFFLEDMFRKSFETHYFGGSIYTGWIFKLPPPPPPHHVKVSAGEYIFSEKV